MSIEEIFWKAKLAAWVHDPVEKALVLFREAHEKGTVRNLCLELFGVERVPKDLAEIVQRADRWSAAADRPDIPWRPGEHLPDWSRVSFTALPELVHPVSPGVRIDLKTTFMDVSVKELKAVSTDHFERLIIKDSSGIDMHRTFLHFWRFGPETPVMDLNLLWQVLPADTRSPDHAIWDHLKLCSSFAGIFALGDEPALLVLNLGPVQSFIAQARTTSDLWAGSHFLSQLCWQAMLPLVETYGPDAILFPDLHGVPVVDQWLVNTGVWPDERLKPWEYETEVNGNREIKTVALDRDPRMAAALPNRFVAIVPSGQINEIAEKMTGSVRKYAFKQAESAAKKVFGNELPETAIEQIEKQVKGFPEVYWTAVPWSMVKEASGKVDPSNLFDMLKLFVIDDVGISNKDTWDILSQPVKSKDGEWRFYESNRGAAYTHLYGLADRLHGSVKTARSFDGLKQEGYRCTICGEREWLTDDRNRLTDDRKKLFDQPGKREETPWNRLASDGTGPIRKGEHLCAWCTLKRFWPSIFPKSLDAKGSRFIVSTHTMALAPSIEKIIDKADSEEYPLKLVSQLAPSMNTFDRPSFPRRLWSKIERMSESNKTLSDVLSRLPAFLDFLSDAEDMGVEIREDKKKAINSLLEGQPETYYALILMDGDRMGEWVAGTNPGQLPRYRDILHSKTAGLLDQEFSNDDDIQKFLNAKRPNTPARHQAISRALNRFSLDLARIVVEEIFTGRLIYSGGDDLLAMVSVQDLPGLMLALRCLYSGVLLDEDSKWQALTGRPEESSPLQLKKGYALHTSIKSERSLYATMGPKATASMGAVIAHHKAPLGRVLRALREAEQAAKSRGGRNAFCLRVEKRAGGALELIGKWWPEDMETLDIESTVLGTLLSLRNTLAEKGVSRRAAYILHDLLRDIPPDPEVIQSVLTYRLERQGAKEVTDTVSRLVDLGIQHQELTVSPVKDKEQRGEIPSLNRWLQQVLVTAEFLARRMNSSEGGDTQ